ncbi:MAG: lamin tail domain-containing protein [Limisphaerales bacterium]
MSEIMYNPAPRTDQNNVEFLEIYNTNPWFEDISGYQVVSDNVSYTFPPGTTLNGGAFLVVAASPPSIQAVYGVTNVVGPYTGSLKTTDTLQLLDNLGAVLLTIPFSNVSPWPVAANGTGHSIVLANPTYGEAQPQAWDISDVVGGSPGQAEAYRPSPLRNVLINEVLAHSENPALPCFIELYNHSNQTNDISGCILTDDFATNKFVIPPGTRIPPRGFLSFSQSQLGFVLSPAGGTLFLVNPDGSRALDAVQFEGQADGVSFGRWPDGAAAFYPLAARTPGTNNSPIWIGNIVINELMYDPISGNDDDQYIELYNRGTNTVSLANWQFTAGVNFTFPPGVVLAPDGYLVVAANLTNLLAKYPNLNSGNTVGNYGAKLSHKGERVALAMPQVFTTASAQGVVTNSMYVVQDEVSYGTGGRWGQWAHGGGSSLELVNPNSNHRLAYNWADSDETAKSTWTNLQYTGVLDNGANYTNVIDHVQLGILDVGECLVDNIAVRPGGPTGANIVANSTFETGLSGWTVEGDHERSSIETAGGLGGYQSSQSLHLRSSDSVWTLADYAQGALSQDTLTNGQTATLSLEARWLHGWPEVLMRLRGNWLEVTGKMPVPSNLGTPGMRNSRYAANAGPAIYEVKHSPPLPPANQPVVVSARFHDVNPLQPTLLYRIDTGVNPTPAYISVPMVDTGAGGDAIAGDGIFSATIPAQSSGTVVAFLVSVKDSLGGTNLFPADIKSNAGVPRECVVAFGDATPVGSFRHQHVFITQNWANRWASGAPGVSHEMHDGTWVDGGGRIIYDWAGRYAGSPYHQYQGSPITTLAGFHWDVPHDDMLYGVTSLDKQHVPGNGVLDDNTLQREQASFWMAHQIGIHGQNRRYYVYFVNGNRHGPLMEDAQTPDGDVVDEYFPADDNGYLYKNHAWFEGNVEPTGAAMGYDNMSWCLLGRFTTTLNGVPNQYKLGRYRWMYLARQYPGSANDYSEVFNLIDAANIPTSNPDYYAQMEAQVDTEEWLRLSAIEHATGDWDSFFTQNQWNMYNYKPTRGKWTALKWDWNITLGGGTSTWGPDGGNLFNYGSADPVMATFHNYPAHQRAYLRAFQDIANEAMNSSRVNPMLDAKYAAFVANGLTTTTWNGGVTITDPKAALEGWIGTMHNSLLAALSSHGVSNTPFAITSVTVNNNLTTISGTAPLAVKTVWFNGVAYPLTWPTVTGWTASVPLQPGTNLISVLGVNLQGQSVSGASATVTATFAGADPSPAGLVVINEIMYNPLVPNAQYVELYNRSPNITVDLSGWQLQGVGYTFPSGSMIQPNSFLVLAANRQAFATAYGPTNLVFDTFPGGLPATGELLTLLQPGLAPGSDLIVNQVLYANTAPWPTNPPGSSLQLRDPAQDNWRVGNWAVCQTNTSTTNQPQWQYVSITGTAPRPILLICMHDTAGDCYVDDLCLVAGTVPEAGANLLTNPGFESPLTGPWTVSANMSGSAITTAEKHSGAASLHVVASSPGDAIADAIWENTGPIVTNGTYTLSYWCLPGANASQLLIRLSGTSPGSGMIYSLQSLEPPSATPPLSTCTPDAPNSVLTNLPAFPPLWLNELQADNLTGITNAAGQRVPWIELYNPGTSVVSLSGLYLANNYSNLTQWPFPTSASIAPGQFKIIFADGQTNLSTSTELHTSFVLPSPTGSLALSRLFNGQPQVLDFMDYTNLPPNYSYGSLPDGQAFARQHFFYATPGGSNSAVVPVSFIPYTAAGSVYTQDFDSLPNPGPVSVNSANPVTINGITYSLANPFDFAAPPSPGGQNGGLGLPAMAGWFGLASSGPNTGSRFGASDGDQTTGGQISFGLPGSANRALGLLATSATGPAAFGAKFINQTTNTFDLISLQFTAEVWRQSDKTKTLQFYYFIDPTAAQPFSTSYSGSIPSLNVTFPALALDAGGAAVDGTLASNQTNLGVINQTIAGWPPGAALWLFWVMTDPTGKAQGLAIDNLSFSASTTASITAPQLSVLNLTGNGLALAWPTVSGALYRVQYKDDLAAPAWTTLGDDLPGAGTPLSVNLDLAAARQRFYRIVIVSGP